MFHDLQGGRLNVDPLVIAAAWGLTPGEAKVAAGVARGETPEEIAAASGVSVNTVKVQLRGVFTKTDTGRQAELVSLLACAPGVTPHAARPLDMSGALAALRGN